MKVIIITIDVIVVIRFKIFITVIVVLFARHIFILVLNLFL